MPSVTYLKTVSDKNLHVILQRIADFLNKDIRVHSGDRPASQNVKGSSSGSLHVAHRAADFHISGMTDTEGFAYFKSNMNKIFDQTEAYEVIQHRPGGATEGPHLHIGRYGMGSKGYRSGYIDFKLDGLEFKKQYNITRVQFTNPKGIPIQPEQGQLTAVNAGATASPTDISYSVGKFGKNKHDDVLQVQFLLNLALRKMTEAGIAFRKYNQLTENGICDDDTIRAIVIFQHDVMGWSEPDGRIDAGGKTLQTLYVAAYNPSDFTLQKVNQAKVILGNPDGGAVEWNGILAWGNHPKVSQEFREKTIRISQELGIKNPSWLMAVMAQETDRSFSPAKKNYAGSTGTGLIQFMKETIDGRFSKKTGKFIPGLGAKLGIKHSDLAGMTGVRQLDIVKAYFQDYGSKPAQCNNVADLYFLVLDSRGFGKDDSYPLFTSGDAYRDNKGLDKNNDHIVTTGEVSQKVRDMLQEGLGNFAFKM